MPNRNDENFGFEPETDDFGFEADAGGSLIDAERARLAKNPTAPTTPSKPLVQGLMEAAGGFAPYTIGSIPVAGPAVQRGAVKGTSKLLEAIAPESTVRQTQIPYKDYEQTGLAALEKERSDYERDNPTFALGGLLVGGGMVPLPGKAATSLASKFAPEVVQNAGGLMQAGLKAGDVAGRIGGVGALVGADAAMSGKDPKTAAQNAMGIAGGLEAGLAGLKGAGAFTRRFVAGVKGKTAEAYRARPDEINAATEPAVRERFAKAFESAKAPMDEAERAAAAAKDEAALAREQFTQNLRDEARVNPDVLEQERRAREALQQRLKDTRPSEQLASDIVEAMDQTRKEVSKKSGEAFKILQDSDIKIPTLPLRQSLAQAKNKLKVGGVVHPDNMPEYVRLDNEMKFLKQVGDEMSARDAKRLIQSLDNAEAQAWAEAARAGGYISKTDRAIMKYRGLVDEQLKQIEPYAQKMEEVSSQTQALKEMKDLIGRNENQIGRKITNLSPPEREALQKFQALRGKNFTRGLEEFEQAKALRGNKPALDQAMNELPETQAANEARRRAAEAQARLQNRPQLRQEIENMPETQAARQSGQNVEDMGLWMEPLKGWSPANLESRIKSLGSPAARSGNTQREAIQYLQEMQPDKGLQQAADDLAVQRALTQGFTNGSRNVNLGAWSLGGLAGMFGEKARGTGSALGAMIGGAADLIGPRAWKAIVDLERNPSFAPYVNVLKKAAANGPRAAAVTHYLLMKNDPAYARMIQQNQQP